MRMQKKKMHLFAAFINTEPVVVAILFINIKMLCGSSNLVY